jgi:hypothetical protein
MEKTLVKNSYNLITQILLGIFLLLHVSCSWLGVRDPAAKKQQAVSIDDVFSIPASQAIGKKDFKESFIASLGFNSAPGIKFETQLSKELPEGVAFKLELNVGEDNFYYYKILHSKNAFKDVNAAYELGAFINLMVPSNTIIGHNLSVFEMYYNALEGDPIALDNFLKVRAKDAYYNQTFSEEAVPQEEIANRKATVASLREELAPQIKELKAQRKSLEASRKAIMDKLDKAPDAKQFRTLVAKNDRDGVADLLKKYLPWEDMAPFEKRYWENQLDVLRKPVPLEQRVLIYRGLNDDFIHSGYDAGKELSKEDAIKEGKAFVMSSVLVKNQGSWNRRLRSLEAMNEKFIGTINDSSEFAQSARISTMFFKHSLDPKGSPFISLTPNVGIAENFGQKQLMSILVDPRLIQFNYVSGFHNEVEFLLPLVTFPDDLVGLWHSSYAEGKTDREYLEEHLKIRIEDEFGKGKADDIIKRIKKNSADFFSSVYNNGDPKITKVTGGTMAQFYKKFAPAKDAIKAPMTPEGNLDCKNLLKIFWAVP